MTPDEFREALAALHLTQVGAAKLLGINPRTSRKWAAGDNDVSEKAAYALKVLQEYRRLYLDAPAEQE